MRKRVGIPPNDYQLGSLGGAENEAKSIAALFKIKPILGNDATKDALLKKLPTAVALRKAMLKTMKEYPSPINWGTRCQKGGNLKSKVIR